MAKPITIVDRKGRTWTASMVLLEQAEESDFRYFEAAWRNRVEGWFGAVRAHYLGLDDLILAKMAAGRLQDRAEVRVLRRAKIEASAEARSRRRRHMPRG